MALLFVRILLAVSSHLHVYRAHSHTYWYHQLTIFHFGNRPHVWFKVCGNGKRHFWGNHLKGLLTHTKAAQKTTTIPPHLSIAVQLKSTSQRETMQLPQCKGSALSVAMQGLSVQFWQGLDVAGGGVLLSNVSIRILGSAGVVPIFACPPPRYYWWTL